MATKKSIAAAVEAAVPGIMAPKAKWKKPVVEFYWTNQSKNLTRVVNVRIIGGNGEEVAPITQGARDKTDAMRSVNDLIDILGGALTLQELEAAGRLRIEGPGPKNPKP